MVLAPTARPSIWWPRQMPKVGTPVSMMSRMTGTAYSPVAAGSPGPLERNTPSGLSAMMSSPEVWAGTTGNRQPETTARRRADGAEADAFEHGPVGENQEGGRHGLGPAVAALLAIHAPTT